jgi:CRP-like cAMP-binding protein
MEKKGDFFNQLAIISELLEQANIKSDNHTILFELPVDEFRRVYNMVQLKAKQSLEIPQNSFNIKIGNVDIIFNTSNV